jgi:hypothetical protein
MRIGLKVGLLAAVIACGAFVAAKAAEDKSYLPPQWFQDKGETTVPKNRVPKTVQARPVRQAHVRTGRRHTAVVHHHRRTRLAYYPGYYRGYYRQRYAYYRPVFPGFLFSFFNW